MKISVLHKNLIRRYLLWAYKTTKESFERIERKTTQIRVDEYLLKRLKQPQGTVKQDYRKFIEDFEQYVTGKRQDEIKQKFTDKSKKSLNPHYLYLKNRLSSIEEAIIYFLGSSELKKIEQLYEQEFTNRILQAREH